MCGCVRKALHLPDTGHGLLDCFSHKFDVSTPHVQDGHSKPSALQTDAHKSCTVDELADMTEDGGRLTTPSASQQLDALLLAHSQTLEPSLRGSLEASSSGVPELCTAPNGSAVDPDCTAAGESVSHAAMCSRDSLFAHSMPMTASGRVLTQLTDIHAGTEAFEVTKSLMVTGALLDQVQF